MERPHGYESITKLDISDLSFRSLTKLPSWLSECKKLEYLNCSFNKITQIDNLPIGLKGLQCYYNNITDLNNLPLTLKKLYCTRIKIKN